MCKDNTIPTNNPSKWKFPKFHKLLHIVDDMTHWSNHQFLCPTFRVFFYFSCQTTRTPCQKRHEGSKFVLQAAQRLSLLLWLRPCINAFGTQRMRTMIHLSSLSPLPTHWQATFGVISQAQHPDITGHNELKSIGKQLPMWHKCIFQPHYLYLFVNALATRFVFAPNTFGTNTHSAVILVFNPEVLFTTGWQ